MQLALDDFGTGYSSLSYLRNLPLDTLKIAREFVEGLAFSDHDAAFVRLIVGLAKTVGLKVVAEGIETRAQLDMLREIGCDLGQGYYFAAADGRRRGLARAGRRRHAGLAGAERSAGGGTRTPTLAAPAPKAGVSANSTTPAGPPTVADPSGPAYYNARSRGTGVTAT